MITTIQIRENVKKDLEKFKESGKESYEDVIVKLIDSVEKQRRKQEKLLIEGYKERGEESLKLLEKFKYADAEVTWEWDGDL